MIELNRELQIIQGPYGFLKGEPLYTVVLSNNNNHTVKLTNFGATITAIYVPDKNGHLDNIVASYEDLTSYQDNPHYFGSSIGRFAGRIAGAKFKLNGKLFCLSSNDGSNHLHGGFGGFNKKVWMIKSFIHNDDESSVIMQTFSPDGEEGYPGNLWATVKYSLTSGNMLSIQYEAVADKSTPISLTNHSYFNLSGFTRDILGHWLQIDAASYTETNEHHVSTGKILAVAGTPMDFQTSRIVGLDIGSIDVTDGYNHNFVLKQAKSDKHACAVMLCDPYSGRRLRIKTNQPGVQVYTANDWTGKIIGPQGYPYRKQSAIALETQAFPDSPNQAAFPNAILHPGERYYAETKYEFSLIDH